MAQDKPGDPINFFLNEQHELAREDRGGGGRLAEYVGINWGTKGQQLSLALKSAAATVEKSNDPLKDKRYFMIAMPEPCVEKVSKDKKKAPAGRISEEPDFGGSHGRVFSRLGIDLIDVGPSGEAVVHATPERLKQLVTRSASLSRLGQREQNRWAAIESFNIIPIHFRVDSDWLTEIKGQQTVDTVIEFQPLLTRLEADTLLRTISKLLREGSEILSGTGSDFTGRYWVRGKLTPKTIKTLATDFFSIQSIHPPQYSVPASKTKRTNSDPLLIPPRQAPLNVDLLPTVAVFDSGIPPNHKVLQPYFRGRMQAATGMIARTGEHGSMVASRIVFGELDLSTGIESTAMIQGDCRVLDVNVAYGMTSIDDKSILQMLQSCVQSYPDVRVFNFSFADRLPLNKYETVQKRERLILTQDLDNFIFANDVLIVVAAGNAPNDNIPLDGYPNHLNEDLWKLGNWAVGFNTLVCGAHVGRLSANGLAKNVGWPSPFTKIGPGLSSSPVPSFCAPGGNWDQDYKAKPGMGEYVCTAQGHWEDRVGTSFAAPILAREAAKTLQLLQKYCHSGAPFTVLAKAFLALVAEPPYQNRPDELAELFYRTLGRGQATSDRLRNPSRNSAVFLWQGVLEAPGEIASVQVPIPEEWYRQVKEPRLRIVVAYDPPVHEASSQIWASRKVDFQLRTNPDESALYSLRGKANPTHPFYPIIERIYNLKRLPKGASIDGDMWLLSLSYADTSAGYHPAITFTPQQRVAFAAELFSDEDSPQSPQHFVRAIPVASTLNRLSVPPAIVTAPIILNV